MSSIQDLREQRAALVDKSREILARKDYGAKDSNEVDAIYRQIDAVDDDLIRHKRAIAEAAAGLEPDAISAHVPNERRSAREAAEARRAFAQALRVGMDRLSPEDRSLVDASAPGNRGRIQNVAIGTNTAGGYLVPTIVMPELLKKLKAFGGVRAVAKSLTTDGGGPLSWPTTDDTVAVGELVGEGVTASTSDMVFGVATLGAYKFSSKIVPVSFEALQDAAIDVEAEVTDALATRIARVQNTFFTTGTGVGQPQGVLTAAALGVTLPAGNTTGVTYDGLINLYHSLDPAYRASPNCAFMLHDTTFKSLKLLKDSQGRPIWLPDGTAGGFEGDAQFDTLLGKKLVINQDMPVMAASAKSILFGDFSRYIVRDVTSMLVFRFTDSAYTSKGQVGFLAWARADGKLIDASNESLRYLANSAT